MTGCGGRIGGFLTAVFIGLVIGGVGVGLAWWGRSTTADARASSSWPTTEAVILSSRLDVDRDEDGDTYEAVVRYRYSVEGRDHEAGRIAFGVPNAGDRGRAEERVELYSVGSTHRVAYDPEDPSRAVLEPGEVGSSRWVTWTGYGLIGLGALFLLGSVIPLVRG